jgi:hypothetical protein
LHQDAFLFYSLSFGIHNSLFLLLSYYVVLPFSNFLLLFLLTRIIGVSVLIGRNVLIRCSFFISISPTIIAWHGWHFRPHSSKNNSTNYNVYPHNKYESARTHVTKSNISVAKEREKKEKAERLVAQKKSAEARSAPTTPKKAGKGGKASGTVTPMRKVAAAGVDPIKLDLEGLNLGERGEAVRDEPPPKMTIAREKVLEEAKLALEADEKGKKALSLVVIGKDKNYFQPSVFSVFLVAE